MAERETERDRERQRERERETVRGGVNWMLMLANINSIMFFNM